MGNIRNLCLSTSLIATLTLAGCSAEEQQKSGNTESATLEASQKVNPGLAQYHERYKEELVKVSDRVYAAYAYDYSNYGYIEGDDGIIVVDAGWFPGQAKRSIADLRKITDKPVKAILYTHLHLDHYGGISAIMDGQSSDVPVYGPKGWENWVRGSFTNLRPMMFKRIYQQMGLLLPKGEDGTVGSGVGIAPTPDGVPAFTYQPNKEVSEYTKLNISGVEVHLIPAPGDLNEHMFIWLPEEDVLFGGDVIAGTFPALETVRFEAERDPLRQMSTYEKILEIDPDVIIGGHGRLLIGKEDVRNVITANRDVTQFMVDQLDRLYLKGLTADQVADQLRLPPAFADHPDLELRYHRLAWMIKTMYLKRAGFVNAPIDFVTLTESEEARRLIDLLGGRDAVISKAREALNNGDARWAARLTNHVLVNNPENADARQLQQEAFLHIARTTDSANERNYMLSIVKEQRESLDWKKILSGPDLQVMSTQDSETLLKLMSIRFAAENADGLEFNVEVTVGDEPDAHYYNVRNNVLFYSRQKPTSIDASLNVDRKTLDEIAANVTDWRSAISDGKVEIAAGSDKVDKLASLIE